MPIFSELKRRRVFQAGLAYLVGAWVLLQVVDLIGPAIGLPARTLSVLVPVAAIGFAVTIVVSWFYDLRLQPQPGEPRITRTTAAPDETSRRVVVLPFRLLKPDPEIDYLGFALADAISCSLTGVRYLVLRSTLSVPQSMLNDPDLRAIARDVDVDAVLTGTVLRTGQELQIRAQLTLMPDGTMLWSRAYNVPLEELFRVQDQLAVDIVQGLALPGPADPHQQIRRDMPSTARAYELYLRANQLSIQSGQWQAAIELYEQCLQEDPAFAPAWARLGRCKRLLAKWESDAQRTAELMKAAEEAFQRALEINPDLALAHSLYAQLELDFGRPEHAMVRLLARNAVAEHVDLLAGLVQACRFCGLLDESRAAYERARTLDPNVRTSIAHTFFMSGDYEAALAEYNNADIGYLEALALAMLGRDEEAILLLRKREVSKEGTALGFYLSSLRALLERNHEEALQASDAAIAAGMGGDGEAAYYMVRQYASMGAAERALTTFDRVIDLGFLCYPAFLRDPWLDGLREHASFKAQLRRAELRHRQSQAAYLDAGGDRLLRPRPSQ